MQLTGIRTFSSQQNAGDEQATLSAVDVARTPEKALDLVHKARTGHKGARETWMQVKKHFPNMPMSLATVQRYVQDRPEYTKIRAIPA